MPDPLDILDLLPQNWKPKALPPAQAQQITGLQPPIGRGTLQRIQGGINPTIPHPHSLDDYSLLLQENCPRGYNTRLYEGAPFFYNGRTPNGIVLAGGAARSLYTGEEIHDFDFYLLDELLANQVTPTLSMQYWDFVGENSYVQNWQKTFPDRTLKVQVIKPVFRNVAHILSGFDLTVCQFALDSTGKVWRGARSLSDAQDKKLVWSDTFLSETRTPSPRKMAMAVEHAFKYASYGYTADASLFSGIVQAISGDINFRHRGDYGDIQQTISQP